MRCDGSSLPKTFKSGQVRDRTSRYPAENRLTEGLNPMGFKKRVFPLLAPVVFEIARLTRNKGMLQFSGRLDNLHVRTFLSEIHDAGWDPQEARKFAMVPQFLSCLKSDATSVVKEVFSHSQSQILVTA
jgi:hypothetical protein